MQNTGTCCSGRGWWRGKGSRYSRYMHNPQFYVSGKRSMHRYSAFILIWFIWYISQFRSLLLDGPLPSPLSLWSKWASTKDNQILQHPMLGDHELRFSWDDLAGKMIMELAKLRGRVGKIHNLGDIINTEVKSMESLSLYLSTFTAFHYISQPDTSSLSAIKW